MKTCAEIETLTTPYLDDELSSIERLAVDSHFAACPPCRDRADIERSAREVTRARAPRLSERAPAALRARCAAAARSTTSAPSSASSRRRTWVPLSMAATLLLAVGGVFLYGLSNRMGAAIAAQLALDHVRCFEHADEVTVAEPHAVEQAMASRLGWTVPVPGGSAAERLELIGGRRCSYQNGRMLHLMYRRDGRPVSLYVLPERWMGQRAVDVMEHEAILWRADGRTYALVGREPPQEMEQLAVYMRQAGR